MEYEGMEYILQRLVTENGDNHSVRDITERTSTGIVFQGEGYQLDTFSLQKIFIQQGTPIPSAYRIDENGKRTEEYPIYVDMTALF